MEKVKKQAKIWLCIGIALMLLGMIVASAVQTGGGSVKIKSLNVETDAGYTMSANLFIPSNATAENPAPAIVTSHGAFNNKEMQDANAVELSRRGYVVLAIDQPSHGNTEVFSGSVGVYQGVLVLSRLPFVDTTRIGVTGHSMGGMSCNNAVVSDNANETRLISAVLLNSADAIYVDTVNTGLSDTTSDEYANIYGNRDVGIIACQYDEFFHKNTDANGNPLSAYYYMEGANSQSFLNFGKDPEGLEKREAFTMYHEDVDGEDCVRIIYRPNIIHPWSHFSAKSTSYTIEFFEEALGAVKPMASSNQVWQWKEAFNFVGLVGLVIFMVNFIVLMLFTPAFSSLRASELVAPSTADKKDKLWFWLSLVVSVLFAMVVFLPVTTKGMSASYVKQPQSYAIGLWAACCGLFSILSMFVYYNTQGKKKGFDLATRGVKLSAAKLGKTIVLAIIVICVTTSCVFFADYFFKTDFRLWTLAFKTFTADKIFVALFPYLPLFLVYYVASSVSFNCFNYNDTCGKKTWVNTAVVAASAAAPAVIMLVLQYGTYFTQKHLLWAQASFAGGNPPMYVLWFFPMVLILPVAAIVSRKVYKISCNPYLAGFVNAAIVTIMTVTNTRTML